MHPPMLYTIPKLSSLIGLPIKNVRVRVRVTLRLTISQSVCLGIEPNLGHIKNVEVKFHAFSALTLDGHDWLPLLEEKHICSSIKMQNLLLHTPLLRLTSQCYNLNL
jgi:hypothetical protein